MWIFTKELSILSRVNIPLKRDPRHCLREPRCAPQQVQGAWDSACLPSDTKPTGMHPKITVASLAGKLTSNFHRVYR